jgi:hypothetical protein
MRTVHSVALSSQAAEFLFRFAANGTKATYKCRGLDYLYSFIWYAHRFRLSLTDTQMEEILVSRYDMDREAARRAGDIYLHGRNLLQMRRGWDLLTPPQVWMAWYTRGTKPSKANRDGKQSSEVPGPA